ncbi:Chondroitin sulfate synthase 1 [Nymphon striatum]|nr:Chondroitin sulfate synthase 1 [Nymphon striatum]
MEQCKGRLCPNFLRMVRYVNLCHQFSAIVGLCLGLILVTWIPTNESDEVSSCPESSSSGEELRESKPIYNDNEENLMFVGVMTAAKFLDSRAAAVYDTWGKTVPGRIAFFTSQNSKTNSNIPIVPLEGVDDVYPPQKKSFLMLKYMHDHFLDDYEWFMRADDDLYVRTDLLANFLRSIRNDKVQFIGQAGLGSNESMEELGLESKDNFCMGGPGMVFSKLTLKKVVPHIKECLQNLYTTHEDVEIGRCIRRFSNVTCTWSYQMQELFYHNRSRQNAYVGRLKSKEVLGAITLHPFKSPSKMINKDSRLVLSNYIPDDKDSLLEWNFFDKTVYSHKTENPHFRMENYQSLSINDNIIDLLMHIQRYNKQRGRIIQFKELLFGYVRVNPMQSVDYILDILLIYRRYKGKKMTLKVRRHAYIQQQFLTTQVQEISQYSNEASAKIKVNILLPLFGRLETFQQFMKNYESVCLKNQQNTDLLILLFNESDIDSVEYSNITNLVKDLSNKYLSSSIRIQNIRGKFSRGLALVIGARLYSEDSLLVFLDVDMIFNVNFLDRVRKNTVQNHSAYFPIIYSQYNFVNVPTYGKQQDVYNIDSDVGYWRMYGYGIVSIYKSDYIKTAGFNVNIVGWGLEDVDLFQKIIKTNITVFRAADPGIVHMFHPPSCDPTINKLQYKMCLGTKYSTIGSIKTLSKKLETLLLNYEK